MKELVAKVWPLCKDCYCNKDSIASDKDETQFADAGNSDSDEVLLMANTQLAQDNANVWYLDTC